MRAYACERERERERTEKQGEILARRRVQENAARNYLKESESIFVQEEANEMVKKRGKNGGR